MVPFRMGILKWTALDIGRFGLVVTPIGSISSQLFVVPWIKKVGNQRAFQVRPGPTLTFNAGLFWSNVVGLHPMSQLWFFYSVRF